MLQPELVATNKTVTKADNGKLLMVAGGYTLTFNSAASLTEDGPFSVGVKLIGVDGQQPTIVSGAGEKVDTVYTNRKLRQTQESTLVTAFVHPTTPVLTGLYTYGGSQNTGMLTGHRTITTATYNINEQDHGILHRCVPGSCGQAIMIVLPTISVVCGINPVLGTGQDGLPAYLSKPFFIQKCDNSAHAVSIAVPGPDQSTKQIHTLDGSSSIVVNLNNMGDGVWLQGMGDGWWPGTFHGIARAPGW